MCSPVDDTGMVSLKYKQNNVSCHYTIRLRPYTIRKHSNEEHLILKDVCDIQNVSTVRCNEGFFFEVWFPNVDVSVTKKEFRISLASNLAVGSCCYYLLDIYIYEMVKRVDMLPHQPSHSEKMRKKFPFLFNCFNWFCQFVNFFLFII